jgi:hypothetical protein
VTPPAAPRSAWTGFNNCTARFDGELSQAVLAPGAHRIEEWATPEVVEFYKNMRPVMAEEEETGWDW